MLTLHHYKSRSLSFAVAFFLCIVITIPALQVNPVGGSSIKSTTAFGTKPYIAIVTQQESCNSDEDLHQALSTLKSVLLRDDCRVQLVSIRVTPPEVKDSHFERRLVQLASKLVEWSNANNNNNTFKVVVSSDWRHFASHVHGIHFKETHREYINKCRQAGNILVGTSCHSVESAVEAVKNHSVDYLFVGTCYYSESHPEKTELEGPSLPGQVVKALQQVCNDYNVPAVLAIGGIDETNCHEPVQLGADGVAIIRGILQASDPVKTTNMIHNSIKSAYK